MKLTQEQLAAANHNSEGSINKTGHARVVAVAGAGKTATLTHYLANRLRTGINPRRILVLMYNRAAKDAFDQRLQQLFTLQKQDPQQAHNLHHHSPTVRTFHSLGLKLYKRLMEDGFLPHASLAPLPSSVIELQIKQLLQTCDQQTYEFKDSEILQEWVETSNGFIQLVKCHLHGPEVTFDELNYNEDNNFLINIFNQFEQWRKDNRSITYDDMLYDPANIFEKHPASQAIFSNILDEILVDEYQDINPIQHSLLKVISGQRAKVMVIGDPDQTIYEFRGSSPQFINNTFAKDFSSPTKYTLSRTFRFGHELSLAANHLISNNRSRDPILTISAPDTPNTKVHLAQTEDHGNKIASTALTLHQNGANYSGMAILCRLWSFARPVELQLMAKGIPYRIEGEESILQCWEIRPFMHFIDILSGSFFNLDVSIKAHALFDILSIPSPKIPHKILRDIAQQWAQTIEPNKIHNSLKKSLPNNLTSYQKRTLKNRHQAIETFNSRKKSCAVLFRKYAQKIELQKSLQESALNPTKGLEQAGTVTAFIHFLQSLPISEPSEIQRYLITMQSTYKNDISDAVTITTIHRSKGREWPAVFIPDITEGHIPYIDTNSDTVDFDTLESERRLMYVAITRAQKKLFLTTSLKHSNEQPAQSRFIAEMQLDSCHQVNQVIDAFSLSSKPSSISCSKSTHDITQRYLKELKIPIEVIYQVLKPKSNQYKKKKRKGPHHYVEEEAGDYSEADHPAIDWTINDRVRHGVLGLGEIISLEGNRISIRFDNGKKRTFVSHLAQPHLSLITDL